MDQRLALALTAAVVMASPYALAQKRANPAPAPAPVAAPATVIYKLVDEGGRVTYSNLPLKGGTAIELDPISVIPARVPAGSRGGDPSQTAAAVPVASTPSPLQSAAQSAAQPATQASASATQVERALLASMALPSVDAQTQKKRDDTRRRILTDELSTEEQLLENAKSMLRTHESDRSAIMAMKTAAEKKDPAAYSEARRLYGQREERLKSLQETVFGHEQNLAALKKELSALK